MKRCARCKNLRALSEFHADKHLKDGLSVYCKTCASRMSREWYRNNSEKVKESTRKYHETHSEKMREIRRKYYKTHSEKVKENIGKWRKENPVKVREISRKYRKTHPEKIKELRRKFYRVNSEKVKENCRKYRKANPEKVTEIVRKWNEANPARSKAIARKARLKNRYNLTMDEYNNLLESQCGKCAICGEPVSKPVRKNLCVDHDHRTKKLRGLLCSVCNLMIGMAAENPVILRKAIAYLKKR